MNRQRAESLWDSTEFVIISYKNGNDKFWEI